MPKPDLFIEMNRGLATFVGQQVERFSAHCLSPIDHCGEEKFTRFQAARTGSDAHFRQFEAAFAGLLQNYGDGVDGARTGIWL